MKRIAPVLFLIIALAQHDVCSQGMLYGWAIRADQSAVDPGSVGRMERDGSGNMILTWFKGNGSGYGSASFGKYNSAGTLVFSKSLSSSHSASFGGVAPDGSGNIFLGGNFPGFLACSGTCPDYTVDLDPGTGTTSISTPSTKISGFFAKYTSTGDLSWGHKLDVHFIKDVETDASGNVYVAGMFAGTVDFDPGTGTASRTASGSEDFFVAKYNSTGVYQWVGVVSGSPVLNAIEVSGSNLFVAGTMAGIVDFDFSGSVQNINGPEGTTGFFIAKYNLSGVYSNGFAIASGTQNTVTDIATNASIDGIYITGSFHGTTDFDQTAGSTTLNSNGNTDIFLAKYSSTLSLSWAKGIGGTGTDSGYGITVTSTGDVYCAGTFTATADFDAGAGTTTLTPAGSTDTFITKYNTSGGHIFSNQIGAFNSRDIEIIPKTGYDEVYLSGGYGSVSNETETDFDPGAGSITLIGDQVHSYGYFAKYHSVPLEAATPNINSSNITDSSTSLAFSASGATGYLILRSIQGTVFTRPQDGTVYTEGNTLNDWSIVYSGTGTSLDQTGLSPATNYVYAVYSYTSGAGGTNYNTVSGVTVVITLAIEPASQPTQFNVSSKTTTNGTITYTTATGSPAPYSYLVVRSTSDEPLSEAPLDKTAYTSTMPIGNGTVVRGSRVIPALGGGCGTHSNHNATPSVTSFADADLAPNTTYYYTIFSYDGSTDDCGNNSFNYKTTDPLTGSFKTLQIEPTGQPTNLSFSNVTASSIDLTVTAAGGSPTGYLVLHRENLSPTETPTDGIEYTPGMAIGSGIVGYMGGGTTFTVSSLSAGTNYFFDVFSYNGETDSYNFLLTSPLEGTRSTLGAEPTSQPTGLTFSNVSTSSMNVSYTAGGTASGYLVLYKQGSDITDVPADGIEYIAGQAIGSGTIAYVGNATTFNVGGLTAATNYKFHVFAYSGNTGTYNYLGTTPLSGNRTTLFGEPAAQPAGIQFSSVSTSSISVAFTPVAPAPSGYIALVKAGGSPSDVPVDGTGYSVGSFIGSSMVAYTGSSAAFAASALVPGTIYYFDIFSYNGQAGTYNYLSSSPLEGVRSTLVSEPSDAPTAITFSSVTPNGVAVSFTAAAGAPTGYLALYKIGSLPDEVPTDGTEYMAGSSLGSSMVAFLGSSTSFALSGLSPATQYHVAIYAFNGSASTYNYRTSTSLNASRFTLAIEPSAQATSIGFSSITASSASVSILPPASAPASWLVLRKEAAAPGDAPSDGVGYATGNSIGGSKVAYAGSSTNFPESGLTGGTQYYYAVFSCNGSGESSNFLVTSPSIGSYVTIPPAPVARDATNVVANGFKAHWDSSTGATSYQLDVSSTQDFSSPVAGFNSKELNGTEDDITGLLGGTKYYYRIAAKNTSGKSEHSNVIEATTSAIGNPNLKIDPPSFPASLKSGNAIITVDVKDGQGPKVVKIFHKGVLKSNFEASVQAALKSGATSSYEATIAFDQFDAIGIEFYIEASDQSSESPVKSSSYFVYKAIDESSGQFIPFAAGFNGKTETYQMFSIPFKLEDEDVSDLFEPHMDGHAKTKWRLFHYQNGAYAEYPDVLKKIEPGKGYWFNTFVSDFKITIGAATVQQANIGKSFTMQLQSGWNQVGNPYPFAISWNAATAGKTIVDELNFYNNGKYSSSDTFKPWTGALVFSSEATTLSIPITAMVPGSSRTSLELTAEIDSDRWLLPIIIAAGEFSTESGVGMHPEANLSRDRFDRIAVPRFNEFVELSTSHPEFFAPNFASDVVPQSNTYSWTFGVQAGPGSNRCEVNWDHALIAGASAQLLLVDHLNRTWVDMKSTSSYAFDKGANQEIEIIYSRSEEILARYPMLGQGYPNPFEGEITFPVLAGKNKTGLRIEILNGLGQRVRILDVCRDATSGQTVSWDGRDQGGSEVAGGVYLCRLQGEAGHVIRVLKNK